MLTLKCIFKCSRPSWSFSRVVLYRNVSPHLRPKPNQLLGRSCGSIRNRSVAGPFIPCIFAVGTDLLSVAKQFGASRILPDAVDRLVELPRLAVWGENV